VDKDRKIAQAEQIIRETLKTNLDPVKDKIGRYFFVEDIPREMLQRLATCYESESVIGMKNIGPRNLTFGVIFGIGFSWMIFFLVIQQMLANPSAGQILTIRISLGALGTLSVYGAAILVFLWKDFLSLGFPAGTYIFPGHYLDADSKALYVIPLKDLESCQLPEVIFAHGIRLRYYHLLLGFAGGITKKLFLYLGNAEEIQVKILEKAKRVRELEAIQDRWALIALDPLFDVDQLTAGGIATNWFQDLGPALQALLISVVLGPLLSGLAILVLHL